MSDIILICFRLRPNVPFLACGLLWLPRPRVAHYQWPTTHDEEQYSVILSANNVTHKGHTIFAHWSLETLPAMSLLFSVTKSTPNTSHICVVLKCRPVLLSESLNGDWKCMTHTNLPFRGRHSSWHVYCLSPICNSTHTIVMLPVYIAIACLQVPDYVDFTATAIYRVAGGFYP